ncbi:MBL fold metallo-hydrolase [Lysobacter korlensis]|uniref:MBL fold metallo-hydrolase n=1 Tax=Lysobacter korlensis TaxID=553636 RepID=A0ABV6RXG6_9GAMM
MTQTHSGTGKPAPARTAGARHNPRLVRNVASGITQLEHAHTNVFLVVERGAAGGRGVTLVDTGLPGTWRYLRHALSAIDRDLDDLKAVVLTHAHFDHLGMARRLQQELSIPIWAHGREWYLAAHPYRYAHESSRLSYAARYPMALPIIGRMAAAGALRVPGVESLEDLANSDELDVPGRPRLIFTPGHTYGHTALHFPDRDAVITGDALVTLDPYTGFEGPQIVSGAATADSAMALASLQDLVATGARVALPGHGDPWRDGIRSAVTEALERGPS